MYPYKSYAQTKSGKIHLNKFSNFKFVNLIKTLVNFTKKNDIPYSPAWPIQKIMYFESSFLFKDTNTQILKSDSQNYGPVFKYGYGTSNAKCTQKILNEVKTSVLRIFGCW